MFTFEIDRKYFDCYEYSLVKDGDLTAELVLDKQPSMLLLDVGIKGTVKLACDVCLNAIDIPTDIQEHLIIKFTDEELDETSEEIIVLDKNDYEFSVADLLYEYITVSVPLFVRCEMAEEGAGCDQEMIKVLQDLEPKTDEGKAHDPRWEMLEKLKKN
ncbi:MAG TPA: DUF177 domain-containing protein [Sphingobacteriaceae bacterium]|nr:DUF177 domain-containing protein [Sphingobacteriaceae bacterium]